MLEIFSIVLLHFTSINKTKNDSLPTALLKLHDHTSLVSYKLISKSIQTPFFLHYEYFDSNSHLVMMIDPVSHIRWQSYLQCCETTCRPTYVSIRVYANKLVKSFPEYKQSNDFNLKIIIYTCHKQVSKHYNEAHHTVKALL